MTGSRIIFTEPASQDGVDMVFSDELRASIDQVMESNCDNIDNVYYESIKGLMFNQKTQLEARQLNGPELALAAIPLVVLLIPMIHQGAGQVRRKRFRNCQEPLLHCTYPPRNWDRPDQHCKRLLLPS
jgi:hypothetical protein